MRERIYLGSISGIVQFIISTIIIFLSIRIFIKNVGDEEYGLFAIVSIIGNMLVFTRLGLDTSLIKYISEQGTTKESCYDIFITYVLLTIVFIPIAFLFYQPWFLNKILGIPADCLLRIHSLIVYLIISNYFLLIGIIFSAMLISQQFIHYVNFIQLVYTIAYWVILIIFTSTDKRIDDLGLPIFLTTLFWFVISVYFAIKKWGNFDLRGIHKNYKRILKKHISYGSKVYLLGVITFLYEPLTKILINQFFGLTVAGYFDIASRLKGQLWGIFGKILMPLLPLMSNIRQKEKIRQLVANLFIILLYLGIVISVYLVFITPRLLQIWLGNTNYQLNSIVISILASYLLFSIPVIPITNYLLATSQVSKQILSQFIMVIINLFIIFIIGTHWDIYSLVASHLISLATSFVILLSFQNTIFGQLFRKRHFQNVIIFTISNILLGFFICKIVNTTVFLCLSLISFAALNITVSRLLKIFDISLIYFYYPKNDKIQKFLINLFVSDQIGVKGKY